MEDTIGEGGEQGTAEDVDWMRSLGRLVVGARERY